MTKLNGDAPQGFFNKDPGMQVALDSYAQAAFGRTVTHSLRNNICVGCGGEANKFNDQLSYQEYFISGLCQHCQDKVFSEE